MRIARAVTLPAGVASSAHSRGAAWLWSGPAVLAAAAALLMLAAPPRGDFPIEDDWLYGRGVKALVEQGKLELPVMSAAAFAAQAYWGALFARAFGFSLNVLRVSTLVLSASGVLACFLLLRDLTTPKQALVGALLLLFNPLYVFLSYSFMTDVPLVSLSLWSLVCYVRALRTKSPSPGWLLAGSTFAAAACMVRQLGLMLPLAAICGLLLVHGWRFAARTRTLLALLLPFLPAAVVLGYLDSQRQSVRLEPMSYTVSHWAEYGSGIVGGLLVRLAGAFSTLGLFTLPLSIGAIGGAWQTLGRRRRLAVGAGIAALGVGYVLGTFGAGIRPRFPFMNSLLSRRGFSPDNFGGSTPESIVIPEPILVAVSIAALLGSGLLLLAVVAVARRDLVRSPAAVPLLFAGFALAVSVLYYQFVDRYLLDKLPVAILVTSLAFPRARGGPALAVTGVAIFAVWSMWWEREYLERREALWEAGQALVRRGVPPEGVDAGYEWAGWYRGPSAMARAVEQARAEGSARYLENNVIVSLRSRTSHAFVDYAPPKDSRLGRVVAVIPYGHGQRVYAIERD